MGDFDVISACGLFEKAPSPTGSDDSGVGLSPRPVNGDGKFHMESPGNHSAVNATFYPEFPGEAFQPYIYTDLCDDISQFESAPDDLTYQQPAVAPDPIEKCITDFEQSLTENNSTTGKKKKTGNRTRKAGAENNNNSISAKRDRCLQPKTGNGKPRQTSQKRKMNPSRGRKPYPGVRPTTVREKLERLRSRASQQRQRTPSLHMQQEMPLAPPTQALTPSPLVTPTHSYPFQPSPYAQEQPPNILSPYSTHPSPISVCCTDPTFSPTGSSESIDHSITSPGSNLSESSFSPTYFPPDMSGIDVFDPIHTIYTQSPSDIPPNVTISQNFSAGADFSLSMSMGYQPIDNTCNIYPNFDPPQTYASVPPTPTFSPCQSNPTEPQTFFEQCQLESMQPQHTGVVEMQQIDDDYCGDLGLSVLHVNVLRGDIKLLQEGLKGRPDLTNSVDKSGMTPLLYAVKNNRLEAVDMLIRYHATPTITTHDGSNVLHFAAEQSTPDVMEYLLQNVSLRDIKAMINGRATRTGGRTPLHNATERKNADVMLLLMNNGAVVTSQEQKNGFTPLHIAVKNADLKATKTILDFVKYGAQGPDLIPQSDVNMDAVREVVGQMTYNENTALHFAAELQSACRSGGDAVSQMQNLIVTLLLDHDADITVKNHQNQLPVNLLPQGACPQLHDRLRVTRRGSVARQQQSGYDFASPPLRQYRGGNYPGSSPPGPFHQ